jgi:hypothetical protein
MVKALSALVVAGLGLATTYLLKLRPRVLAWGATAEEVRRAMPGDQLVPDASLETTRAVTIKAPPGSIWPWLAQMGPRPRAGAYTYAWIERLLGIDIENANRILPDYQHLNVGDFIALDRTGKQGLLVRELQAEHFVAFQWKPAGSSWAFGLYPTGPDATRLVSRNRLHGGGLLFWLQMLSFMELGSLLMERKMLLGIKRRAEGGDQLG